MSKYPDSTLRQGDRVIVTIDGISAHGTFVAGIGRRQYQVTLDGTAQMIAVPGEYLERESQRPHPRKVY